MLLVFALAMVFIEPLRRLQSVPHLLPPPASFTRRSPHRNQTLVPRHAQHGVVALRPPRGGVDEDVHRFVDEGGRGGLGEHDVEVHRLKHLLTRVECEPSELALDQVGPVLHDGLELHVPVGGLPPVDEGAVSGLNEEALSGSESTNGSDGDSLWHKVEAVDALGPLSFLDALLAGELDLLAREEGQPRDLVAKLDEPRVEVDLVPQGGDGDDGGVLHEQERGYGLLSSSDSEWESVSSSDCDAD